jgi:hypothetical protein
VRAVKISLALALILASAHADLFFVGVHTLSFDYTERDDHGFFLDSEDSDYGDVVGIDGGLTFAKALSTDASDTLLARLLISYTQGHTRYNGFLQNGPNEISATPYRGITDNALFTGRFEAALQHDEEAYSVSVFAGAGYRYWQRDLDNRDGYGYGESYRWPFLSFGTGAQWHVTGALSIGVEGAYRYAVNPQLDADIDGGLTLDLGTADGFMIDVPITWRLESGFFLQGSYTFDRWRIKPSNIVYGASGHGYQEPGSTTNNRLLSFRVGYEF